MAYPSDLSNEQWDLLEPLLVTPGKRGPRFGADLRRVVDGMLYIAHTGCQWRFLPAEFGPWTRVWSQFRRWSRNGTWALVLAELHAQARLALGRMQAKPSMVVIDTHLARGASNGGVIFHRRGGPYGYTNGAKRIVAVDATGLPLAGRVVSASTPEPEAVELLLADLAASGQNERLELVLIDRGTSKRRAQQLSATHDCDVRRVGWDEPPRDDKGQRIFRPIAHAWRVEVAHGLLGRQRRLARSFENTCGSASAWLQVVCAALVLRALAT